MVEPIRGSIYWVNLDPTIGTEIKKTRPCLVVSNNQANSKYGQVTVLPLTSQNVDKIEPFQVLLIAELTGLPKTCKALAEQIRTISKLRLGRFVSKLQGALMKEVDKAVKIHLGLE